MQGDSSYPFAFRIPENIPQSLMSKGNENIEISYFFKVQLIPVSIDHLVDKNGKSNLRAREKIKIGSN